MILLRRHHHECPSFYSCFDCCGARMTQQQSIRRNAAVRLIAEAILPDLQQKKPDLTLAGARKQVRARIVDAQNRTGHLPAGDPLPCFPLFRWAIEQKGWEHLRDHLPSFGWAELVFPTPCLSATVHVGDRLSSEVTIRDPATLNRLYNEALERIDALTAELAQCREHLAGAETEVADWRRKDAELRAKKSKAGKKGGRGRAV